MRAELLRTICATLLLAAETGVVRAEDSLLCIRGKSFASGREFLQTRQLKLHIAGAAPAELVPVLAANAVREKLWPELNLDEVQVSAYDSQLCGYEPAAEVSVEIAPQDLPALKSELSRGPGDRPRLNSLARGAKAKAAATKSPPIGTASAARRHEWAHLYFATTRHSTGVGNAAAAFGGSLSDKVTFGTVDVSIPADHRWAKLESPSVVRLEWDTDPKRHVKLANEIQVLTSKAFRTQLAHKAGAFDKPGVLLFVHGYNNSFEEAALRAGQLAYDLAFPGPTVLFSWPSDGNPLPYFGDEEKARTAWRQMAEVLHVLTQLGPGVPVYIVAHSMGNRVLTQGLAQLLRQRPGADKNIRQIVLASPDIGEEEFRQRWIYELRSSSAARYTMYASKQDLPVALSAWLHGERRLGSGGRGIAVLSGLDSIDASAITREWFGLSHSYFGDNETVLSDLFLVIHHGLEPSKRPRLLKVHGSKGDYWEFKR